MHFKRTLILHENNQPLKDLTILLPLTIIKSSLYDAYKETDKILSLLKKTNCSILISSFKNILTVGRTFESEFIDLYKYEIINQKGFKDFNSIIEVGFKYFLIFQGLENHELCFWTDLFQNFHTSIDIEAVQYIVIIKKERDELQIGLFKLNLKEVGPSFSLKYIDGIINEEKYNEACIINKQKINKNIKKTDLLGKIGRIHVPKQDFSGLKLKKRK